MAGNQRVGGDGKFKAEEFLYAEQMGNRLMRRAARNEMVECGTMRLRLVAHPCQQHLRTRNPEHMRHQQFGIEAGGIVGGGQALRRDADRVGDGHSDMAASRFASSSAISASTSSPSPGPAMICGSFCSVRPMR